jgi:hypothetical protein
VKGAETEAWPLQVRKEKTAAWKAALRETALGAHFMGDSIGNYGYFSSNIIYWYSFERISSR